MNWQKVTMSPALTALCLGMAAAQTVYEARMKQYWSHTYRMMKAMKGEL